MDAPQAAPGPARVVRAPARNRRFLSALLLALLGVALWVAWPYRAAVVMALVLGYVLRPLYLRLLRVARWRSVAAGVTLLLVAVAMVAPLAFLAWHLLDDVSQLRGSVSGEGYRARAVELLGTFGVEGEAAGAMIDDAFAAATERLQALLVEALAGALDLLLGLVVFFLLLFYVLVDGDRLVAAFHAHVPLSARRRERLLRQTGDRVRAIVLGTFVVYALQGIVGGIGWWIFGFPAPVFWGFVMTILAVLPFMGPQLVTVPAGLLALMQGDVFAGVGLLVWTFVAVGLIDDLVRPWVIGRRSGVHPALILVGTLGGLKVLGLAGLVLGPLILGLLGPVLDVWSRDGAGDAEPAPARAPPRGLRAT